MPAKDPYRLPQRFNAIPRKFVITSGSPAGWFRNQVGQWLLVVGPASLRARLTALVVGLAREEDVRLLDAGDHYDPALAAHLAREEPRLLERIRRMQPANCLELLAFLERAASTTVPFVALDLLRKFYEPTIAFHERRQILQRCFQNLRRLQLSTSGLVSLSPPRAKDPQAAELFALVEAEARKTFDREVIIPAIELRRLYAGEKGKKK